MVKRRIANSGRLYDPLLFTVEGSGVFPFDMLRYDACWPYSEGRDSGQLDSSFGERARRRVVLQTLSPNAPTEGRWQSFGWRVIGEGEHRFPSPTTASDADVKAATIDVLKKEGLIQAVRFYRATLYDDGRGKDPGLKESVDLIRDKWATEIVNKGNGPNVTQS